MKKLLSLLGSVAIVGGSSATIVACGTKPKADPKENPIEVAKAKLKNLIEEAKGLVSTSRKEESVTKKLEGAIGQAQQVLDKKAVSETELTNETVALQEAIDKFKQAEDKEPIVIAKEALQDKIKEAEALVAASRKEVAVTNALQTAIDEAKMALNNLKATETTIKEATQELTKAIAKFNQAKNLDQQLREKIDETKRNKAELEDKNNQNGWNAIAAKSQMDFESVINEAETTIKKDKLTKDDVDQQFVKLDNAIESFKSTLPQTIISQAINLKQEDIKNLVFEGWSYDSFWKKTDGNARLVNLLVDDVNELAKEHHYTEAERTKLEELIVKHFDEKVKLVYLNEQNGQQKIKKIIDSDGARKTLKEIFLENVKEEFPEEDLTKPNFWEQHPKLSLGIKFGTDNLIPETREFWSFTLVRDVSPEDQDDIQRLFREAETRDGGSIILEFTKGISKANGDWLIALKQAIQKKVFYGKRFFSELHLAPTQAPNDEQLKDGILGWKTKKDAILYIKYPTDVNKTLFTIKMNLTINIR